MAIIIIRWLTQHGTANAKWFLLPNTEEKFFFGEEGRNREDPKNTLLQERDKHRGGGDVPRLCRYGGQINGEDCCVYPKSIEGVQVRRPNDYVHENVARLRAGGFLFINTRLA